MGDSSMELRQSSSYKAESVSCRHVFRKIWKHTPNRKPSYTGWFWKNRGLETLPEKDLNWLNPPSLPCGAKDKNISGFFYIWSKKRHEKSILSTRFEQFSLYADALPLNSLFLSVKKKRKPWLWDTVWLSVFLSPPGDGRWHLFGRKINSLYEISKLPHSFFDLI